MNQIEQELELLLKDQYFSIHIVSAESCLPALFKFTQPSWVKRSLEVYLLVQYALCNLLYTHRDRLYRDRYV